VSCCSPRDYGDFFNEKVARRDAERYRRKGLGRASRRFVELVSGRGIDGATVLEIGGGTGTLQLELLARGAARTENVELSPAYEVPASALLEERGLSARVDRRVADFAAEPDVAVKADVVLLHRVVCCYPDYETLLAAAATKAQRVLAFSFPLDTTLARAVMAILNLCQRVRGCGFRSYVHSERAMLDVAARQGFHVAGLERAGLWRLALLER
jgi:predicted RNA methylase